MVKKDTKMSFTRKSLQGIKNFFADVNNLYRDQEVIIDYYYFNVSVEQIKNFCEEVEKISQGVCPIEKSFQIIESRLQYLRSKYKKDKKNLKNWDATPKIPNPENWESLLKKYKRHSETNYDDTIKAIYFLKNNGFLDKKEVDNFFKE